MEVQLTSLHIEGFRRFDHFDLELHPTFNVVIGDNETGKTSLLKAIELVLTGQYEGRLIQYAIDPYMFNQTIVSQYFLELRKGKHASPPSILIEAYLSSPVEDPAIAKLKGTNNSRRDNCPGLFIKVELDHTYTEEMKLYASDESNPTVLPVEYFAAEWRPFSDNTPVTIRKLPFRTAMIDTTRDRSYRGPARYLSQVASEVLSPDQRRDLSLEYRRMQHRFSQEPQVQAINEHLEETGGRVTKKRLTIQMDMSSRASWDTTMTPHLDDLPFDSAGKGEQSRVQLRLAVAGVERSHVVLIEEPENHLSHSHLNMLIDDLMRDCENRQVVVATHSAFVLNKLGIDRLTLISLEGTPTRLSGLSPETRDYFMKLPGYDTLRLLLSKRCILVEGPSDELIVQRAYKNYHGRLPLEDGVDVVSVGSLAFKRFLELATPLQVDVRIVTDNDGDLVALRKRYGSYLESTPPNVRICFDTDETCATLEPQLLKANSLSLVNCILDTDFTTEAALLDYMGRHKTDCALKFFNTTEDWNSPQYIADAIT